MITRKITSPSYSWYFDPYFFDLEQRTIFAAANEYVGAVPMVTEQGRFYTLGRYNHTKFIINNNKEVLLMSNVCPHRNMLLLEGTGKVIRAISCPMHKWSFNLDGQLLKAPHYEEQPCVSLKDSHLHLWNGLLFRGPRNVMEDFLPFQGIDKLDISHYELLFYNQEIQPVNWKIPIEVFLDNYHLPYVHPGLNLFTHPANWFDDKDSYEDDWLVYQTLPANPRFEKNTGSETYERWQNKILELSGGILTGTSMVLALYFPNTLLEWWPYMFVVTTYKPLSPEQTLMVREYYFDPEVVSRDPAYPAIARQAYDESQAQDDVLHEGIHAGRKQGYREKASGPAGYPVYQTPTEDCVRTFHERLAKLLHPDEY